jgi:hypothetical protein
MFEINFNGFQPNGIHSLKSSDRHARRLNTAINLFNEAVLRGRYFRLMAGVRRRAQWLLDLEAVKSHLRVTNVHYIGIQPVHIDRIIGSEGRAREFDRAFHPVDRYQRDRWAGMAMACLSRTGLPPVLLIRVGEAYFVRDGHHRISVASMLGQSAVDAEVIVWETGACPTCETARMCREPAAVPA